jgi:hypothetical protein
MLRVALRSRSCLAVSILLVGVHVGFTSAWATEPDNFSERALANSQANSQSAAQPGTLAGTTSAFPNGSTTGAAAGVPAGAEDTDAQLRRAVSESVKQFGNLDPQQKKIFDEEVVPQYSFFVKDYSQVGNKVSVQVDADAIKSFLGFSAAKNIPTGTTQLLLYLKADPHCPKCIEAAPAVKKSMQARAERRGFVPVWITPEELVDTKPVELAEKRNASGSLAVELKPAPMDDVDSAHADEKRFVNSCAFDIRGVLHYEDQSEIYDTDSFEQTSAKLLTQAFVQLGAKTLATGAGVATSQEMQIQVSGITNFNNYTQLKSQLQARLKDLGVVEERKISRGHAVFAIKTSHALDEFKQALTANLQLGGTAAATMTGAHDQTIEMEMR